MRFLGPLFVFLVAAAFHAALSASLESREKEEKVPEYDGLTELQKIDQMEFEAAQKTKEAHVNVSEEFRDEARYLEAAKDGPAFHNFHIVLQQRELGPLIEQHRKSALNLWNLQKKKKRTKLLSMMD
ncbi:uncharacterized protein FYW49_016552 [Xenentodon cancila]